MTERTLTRRRLLVAGGTVLVAGCGGDGAPDDERFAPDENRNDRVEQTEQATPADGPTTAEETPAETATESTDDGDAEETATETPTRADSLDTARTRLTESVRTFIRTGNAESFVGVDGSARDLDEEAIRDRLDEARDHLDRAEPSPEVDGEVVTALRAFAAFVDAVLDAQLAVVEAFGEYDQAVDHLRDEQIHDATKTIAFLDDRVEEAREAVETFTDETSAADLEPLDVLSPEDYDAKVEQLETELDDMGKLDAPLEHLKDGLDEFADGVDEYIPKNWNSAYRRFAEAQRQFRDAQDELLMTEGAGAPGDLLDRVSNAVDSLESGTDSLLDSCAAGSENNDSARKSDLRRAKRILRGGSFVGDLPSVGELDRRT